MVATAAAMSAATTMATAAMPATMEAATMTTAMETATVTAAVETAAAMEAGATAVPAMEANAAAPAETSAEAIAAPIPAGTVPTIAIEAIIAPAPDIELGLGRRNDGTGQSNGANRAQKKFTHEYIPPVIPPLL
jgi:hypothetical protein